MDVAIHTPKLLELTYLWAPKLDQLTNFKGNIDEMVIDMKAIRHDISALACDHFI